MSAARRARRLAGAAGVVATLSAGAAAEPAPQDPPPLAGALSPASGKLVLGADAGMTFVLPTLGAFAAIGLGAGLRAELRYRNIAALGHAGAVRLAWGGRITRSLAYGVAARTSITSLAQADLGIIGLKLSSLPIGNDWLVGSDIVFTWLRRSGAQVTAAIGPTFTLGGVRYASFTESSFQIEPAIRALTGSVQGEWQLRPRLNLYLRLDADVLLHTRIQPLGFIPTGVAGLAWAATQ